MWPKSHNEKDIANSFISMMIMCTSWRPCALTILGSFFHLLHNAFWSQNHCCQHMCQPRWQVVGGFSFRNGQPASTYRLTYNIQLPKPLQSLPNHPLYQRCVQLSEYTAEEILINIWLNQIRARFWKSPPIKENKQEAKRHHSGTGGGLADRWCNPDSLGRDRDHPECVP